MRTWGLLALLLVGCGAGGKNANRVDMPSGGVVDTAVGGDDEPVDPDTPAADRARAHEHLPGDCDVVVRLRLDQLANAPAIKNRLIPAFVAEVEKESEEGEIDEFFAGLEVDPGRDLRGTVACIRGVELDDPDYVVAIGGDIAPGRFVPTMDKHAEANEFRKTEVGSMVVLEDTDDHLFMTQCGDGTILIANRISMLTASHDRARAFERYDLPFEEQMVAVATQRGTQALIEQFGSELSAIPPSFEGVRRVEIFGSLATGRLGIELDLSSADDAQVALQAVELAKGQVQGFVVQNPDIGPVLDSLEARADGARFTASVVVPAALIDQFILMSVSDLGDAEEEQ